MRQTTLKAILIGVAIFIVGYISMAYFSAIQGGDNNEKHLRFIALCILFSTSVVTTFSVLILNKLNNK